ncbi:RNA polymerase sigma factor [Clostridium botulinum]|uniref:RNA polymerase sigma factor n=1 Tax=Clostridium botulinum TaxID=1491 RepID=UPI0004D3BB68|nr:RNA polymerase sigma factor [Clostridium botulinum]KEH99953.1 RNA polymerase sigma factor [Clostridium botulinum C/D str. BKT75002]KEI05675.1 RNA polymerase sigma factor [Clostridium botulinum C/D str. BKT2873]MCD3352153.1 RNA polymerase sigma factor [Clostridium botulinum D/C]MCD3361101.1 RNA polymerase sigma factor [Clostridium botulinum D/C]MCD3363449.1 RNA polymerase sigma factor [Clostridium botulinum D/C]
MDNELLLDLYKRQAKIIFSYLIKCGCKSEEAEDIVQEGFIKAIEYMGGVSNNNMSSWLFTVCMNNFKNRINRRKNLNKIIVNSYEPFLQDLYDTSALDEVLLLEKKENIRECLNLLKEEYKSLLIFKYELDLSYKEISLLLGISEDVIKTYLYRARNKFKEIWREQYE